MNDQLRKKLALWILLKIILTVGIILIMRKFRVKEDDAS